MHPRTFILTLWGSLSSAAFYGSILRRSVWFSVRFVVIACLILGLLKAVDFNLRSIPQLQAQTTQLLARLEQEYPADLVFSWDMSTLSWQPPTTLSVPYPPEVSLNREGLPPVLAQFSPQEGDPSTLLTELPQRSLMLITPSTLYILNAGESWNTLPFTEVPGFESAFTISRDTLGDYLTYWQTLIAQTIQVLQIGSFVVFPLFTVIRLLVNSVIDATIFYFLIQLSGPRWRWSKVWQLTLHIVVVALLLETLIHWLLPSSTFPIFTITSWGLFVYLVLMLKLRTTNSGEPRQ